MYKYFLFVVKIFPLNKIYIYTLKHLFHCYPTIGAIELKMKANVLEEKKIVFFLVFLLCVSCNINQRHFL